MVLNNREVASIIWVFIFIVYASLGDNRRQSLKAFKDIIRAFFVAKIIVVIVWALLWIILCVQALRYVGAWEIANLKTTLLWAVTFAFVTLFDVVRISEDDTYFWKTVRDTVSATVAITFIAEAYTFPFVVELSLVPLLALMTVVQVVSEREPEHALLHKVASTVLALAGIVYIGHGLYMATEDFRSFATWDTLQEFLTPITLSLLFLPYLYVVSVLVSYEMSFAGLHWALKDDKLRRYAAFQAVLRFRFNLEGLRRWKRHVAIFRPTSRGDILSSIAEIKANQKRARNPFPVSPELGWCPIAASKFLEAHDLATGDYHRFYDGQWYASSPMRKLNETSILPDNIAYYIEGDENAAKRLKVRLNVNDKANNVVSDMEFQATCASLVNAVFGEIPPELKRHISHDDVFDVDIGGRGVHIQKEYFLDPARGYSKTLTIDYSTSIN